ncbi:hypothetical protein LSUB1_G006640 [Lachnellula subtilissima]|uniref:NmrA-like domain-containing protein n=1 Tax=Lachnellula subtilissima TaxID=602034 RepID=A0A8H8RL11_9HELO|nr:hypothetical protein LSUB1_G006640 [Lachnellula subtilissima]
MSSIENFAVVGASGTVGIPITTALLSAGFHVTAITSSTSTSTSTFPPSVTIARVNYHTALVARFMPSEFGIDLAGCCDTQIGALLGQKREIIEYLGKLAGKYDWFTWTALSTGSFIDWLQYFVSHFTAYIHIVLKPTDMFEMHFENKMARIYDSGNKLYYPSTLSFVGKSVAAVLKKPAETANKYLTVASFTTSQREVLKIVEEMGERFQFIPGETSNLEIIGDEKMARGDGDAFVEYLIRHVFGDGAGGAIEDNAAGLLGLEEEDLRTVVKRVLSEL